MNQHSFPSKALGFFAYFFILLSLVASGCAPAAPATVAPAATQAPATEAPTEPTATEATAQGVNLTFLYPGTSDSTEGTFISNAVDQFQGQTGISVDLQFVPGSDYLAVLSTRVEAGDPPDLARLVFFDLFQFYRNGNLLSVEDAEGAVDDDFLKDAEESALFDGQHYGLPQRRDSCALAYGYLSIFNATAYPMEAFQLMDFLTQTSLQEQAYQELLWYPTRQSTYDTMGLSCPANEAIRLPVDVQQTVFEQVPERAQLLQPVLEGGIVLDREATGVFENEELIGFAAPVWSQLSAEEAKQKMETTGLVMGVLFIDSAPEYDPGNYVVKCFTQPNDYCVLVDPSGNEHEFDLVVSEELAVPVEVPRVSTEPGSERECYWILFWKRCTTVG